ncbi:TlpA disulfide reductase family protein [Parapedobacter soli]|uniref:TlpA disulfide reductase family protein n=1 Tax=Parapedobacter soli TaxID=416955 RepID=UPI0021C82AC5|nr:TlpA disulfide reductase family protein [Parapedobacter soli]
MYRLIQITVLTICVTTGSNIAAGQETTAKPIVLGAIQRSWMISGELVGGKSKHIVFAKAHEHPYARQILVPVIDGKFQFTLPAGHPEAYMLIPEENFNAGLLRPFVVFSGENVYVTLHPGEGYAANTVSGSPLTNEYHKFRSSIKEQLATREAEIDSLHHLAKDSLLGMAYLDLHDAYITEHPTLVSYQLIKELLIATNDEATYRLAEKHYPAFAARFPDNPYTEMIGAYLNGRYQLQEGKQYVSFHADDLEGNRVLADSLLAAKATLLNFWASWCGPCIKKTRTMVPVYEAFNEKGFDIVNIAREIRNTDALVALLEREKPPWSANLIDLESKYGVWTKYGITNEGGAMVLIDAAGAILAVNPTADEVKDILEKIVAIQP